MVFINKLKELIKVFEESSRENIGIALMAYENFISYNRKVNDSDLNKLTKVYKWFDDKLSDDYPNLINESLQNIEVLICNMESDFIKDGYKIDILYNGRSIKDDSTFFNVEIKDNKTGTLENEVQIKIKDSSIGANYDNDSFNTIYKAVKEVKNKIQKNSIQEFLNNYKL